MTLKSLIHIIVITHNIHTKVIALISVIKLITLALMACIPNITHQSLMTRTKLIIFKDIARVGITRTSYQSQYLCLYSKRFLLIIYSEKYLNFKN